MPRLGGCAIVVAQSVSDAVRLTWQEEDYCSLVVLWLDFLSTVTENGEMTIG